MATEPNGPDDGSRPEPGPQPPPAEAPRPRRPASDFVVPGTPHSYADLVRLSVTLYESRLLGKHIQNAQAAFAIMVTGAELGLPPMASLRNIAMVEGKPTLDASLLLGLFHEAGGKSRWLALDSEIAELELTHPDGGEPVVVTWTMEDARRAELTKKDTWRKYPRAMLRSRAITEGTKTVGWQPAAGIYTPEELERVVTETPDAVPQPPGAESAPAPDTTATEPRALTAGPAPIFTAAVQTPAPEPVAAKAPAPEPVAAAPESAPEPIAVAEPEPPVDEAPRVPSTAELHDAARRVRSLMERQAVKAHERAKFANRLTHALALEAGPALLALDVLEGELAKLINGRAATVAAASSGATDAEIPF